MSSTAVTYSLFEIEYGTTYSISHINEEFFNPNTLRRLAELGFRTGIPAQTLQRTSGNGRLVAIESVRYAIDKKSAHNIFVTAYSPQEVETSLQEVETIEIQPTHESSCCCCKESKADH